MSVLDWECYCMWINIDQTQLAYTCIISFTSYMDVYLLQNVRTLCILDLCTLYIQ